MFSNKTILNGVELPPEFNGGNIINNIAVSRDGLKYAVIGADRQVLSGDVPSDGVLEINGTKLTVKKGQGVAIRGTSISNISQTTTISGSGSVIINNIGDSRGEEIARSFPDVTEVVIQNTDGDLKFAVHESAEVGVKGVGIETLQVCNGVLDLGDFEGSITLPHQGVRIAAKTASGNIDGEISSPGLIKTMSGDIDLKICGPIAVRTSSMSGDVDVRGMMSAGRNTFEPPNAEGQRLEMLTLETMSGDVTLRYSAAKRD